ncbi:MAG: VWA domain-containing protein [Bacteroidales bacterium]|nr:VWA domain-containing protein [Bacteroidales bacterium]MBN2757004.1 VWA domain-containing protein [Bacteroidales bacterium]
MKNIIIKMQIISTISFLLIISSCGNNSVHRDRYESTKYSPQVKESAEETEADMDDGLISNDEMPPEDFNTESYDKITENAFVSTLANPLSTFSIDVDRAAYANIRRFINNNQNPPQDAVRIEEMINYFNYSYPLPKDNLPFSVNLELANCPWNTEHQLVTIGLKGKEIDITKVPASNLVFLLDVSGSMDEPNKLPLLKSSLKILIEKLRPADRVAIVVYAGAAGLVLPSTSCDEKYKIMASFEQLQAGGSTAGGEGINLAYKIAKENFIDGGNNRIILATDGDFNIGESSDAAMERLIEKKREEGIFLTVLGFGMGNYKDSKMEKLSNAGNGNYAYIDNILEAKKTLGKEFFGTIFTIAKDVKIQIEFNPAKVKGYRLIGYENRMLKNEDFNNDKKDAGDIGAGHTVTALYEIIPASSKEIIPGSDKLEYQTTNVVNSDDLMTIKLRYKEPDGAISKLIKNKISEKDIKQGNTSQNFKWAAAVSEFGLILRNSEFKGTSSYKHILELAKASKGNDDEGYRAEFIKLVETSELLSK